MNTLLSAIFKFCTTKNLYKKGSSDADVRAFGCKIFWIFCNLWCVCTDKGGLSQCRHFADLWTALYSFSYKIAVYQLNHTKSFQSKKH